MPNAIPPSATHPKQTAMQQYRQLDEDQYVLLYDDFVGLSTGKWTALQNGTPTATAAIQDGLGGIVKTFSDNVDDCYDGFASPAESFIFNTTKPLSFAIRMKLTEVNTNNANWCLGVSDTLTTGMLQTAGAGPIASYDGAIFFKLEEIMYIQFETSNAATQVTNATLAVWTSGVWYQLGFDYDPNDGVTGKITPWVYNETTGVKTIGAVHSITISGLEEMHAFFQAGASSTEVESIEVDKIKVVQLR